MNALPNLYLVRHGETQWSASHRHTGCTDIALTPAGETQAKAASSSGAGSAPYFFLDQHTEA